MGSIFGRNVCKDGACSIPQWALLTTAGLVFLQLLAIVVLSICLCKFCKKGKKQKLLEGISDNTCEDDVHYAELQNFSASSGEQIIGATRLVSLAIQDSDYATVAVLKELPSEENCSNDHQKADSGVEEGMREDHLSVEAENVSYYDQE